MISAIIGLIITGAIIGALARLVVPGKQNMSILLTIGLGIVGALVGGLVARGLGLGTILYYVVAVAIGALLVYLVAGRSATTGTRSRV